MLDKYADVKVQFTREEWEIVGRQLPSKAEGKQWGGWQNTLAEVQRRTDHATGWATLPATLIGKCQDKAEEHLVDSRGTWQTVFRTIMGAVRRARAAA